MPAGTRPLVTSTGVTVKPAALHGAAVMAVTAGFGLTVTVNVNVDPTQVPVVGVTVYVAVCAELVGLLSVPVMLAGVPTLAAPPVIPPVTPGAAHV